MSIFLLYTLRQMKEITDQFPHQCCDGDHSMTISFLSFFIVNLL